MKRFILLLVAVLMFGQSHAQTDRGDHQSAGSNTILILSPQGVDPANDTAKFNGFARGVTQAFSEALSGLLTPRGLVPVNVIDQDPKYQNGEKLAIHSVKHRVDKAVMLLLVSEVVDGDSRLNLQAQYIEQDFLFHDDGRVRGVKPKAVLNQTYLLHSAKDGASPKDWDDLAEEFVAYLKSQGRL